MCHIGKERTHTWLHGAHTHQHLIINEFQDKLHQAFYRQVPGSHGEANVITVIVQCKNWRKLMNEISIVIDQDTFNRFFELNRVDSSAIELLIIRLFVSFKDLPVASPPVASPPFASLPVSNDRINFGGQYQNHGYMGSLNFIRSPNRHFYTERYLKELVKLQCGRWCQSREHIPYLAVPV